MEAMEQRMQLATGADLGGREMTATDADAGERARR